MPDSFCARMKSIRLISSFHMTSLKFRLHNYRSYWDFTFMMYLEQLKTNFHANFRVKRVLGFVTEYAWTFKLLRDAAITWRPRELSRRLKRWCISGNFARLSSSCIRKSITLMFMSSSRNKFTLLYQNSVTDVFVGFRPPCWCPSR